MNDHPTEKTALSRNICTVQYILHVIYRTAENIPTKFWRFISTESQKHTNPLKSASHVIYIIMCPTCLHSKLLNTGFRSSYWASETNPVSANFSTRIQNVSNFTWQFLGFNINEPTVWWWITTAQYSFKNYNHSLAS